MYRNINWSNYYNNENKKIKLILSRINKELQFIKKENKFISNKIKLLRRKKLSKIGNKLYKNISNY